MKPEDCNRFDVCSANLCPLDAGLSLSIWYADEAICKSRTHGNHRWVKKQRSIQRRQTQSWLEKPITYQMLYETSRKREVKPETLERLKIMRGRKQTQWREELTPSQP